MRKQGVADWTRVKSSVQTSYTYTGLNSATVYEFSGGYQLIDKEVIYFDPITQTVL